MAQLKGILSKSLQKVLKTIDIFIDGAQLLKLIRNHIGFIGVSVVRYTVSYDRAL